MLTPVILLFVHSPVEFWDDTHRSIGATEASYGTALEDAASYFGDVAGKTLIDLGCGAGAASLFFARLGANITAVDNSQTAIGNLNAHCSEHGIANVTAINMDALDINQLDPVDLVFGDFVLHHLEPFDRVVFALRSALKPEGKGFFRENNGRFKLLMWCRDHLAGRYGIPKLGDTHEQPLNVSEIDALRTAFRVRVVYPELFLMRVVATYLFRNRHWNAMERADFILYRVAPFLRKYSYRQYIYLGPR